MVSFRNSQLQAIVIGLVVADALSQGQLPWPSGRSSQPSSASRGQAAGAIADDRWSQRLSHQFQPGSDAQPSPATGTSSLPLAPLALAAAPALPALLAQLPWLLGQLEAPLPTADLATTTLRDGLNACLQRDATALIQLQRRCEVSTAALSPAIAASLSRAIAVVLAAGGDFQLAVGQSLHETPAIVGLPVLTGILSAGWGDLLSLPCGYRQALNQPDPSLQAWLQRRWQITNGAALSAWATDIWRSWLGLDRRATAPLPMAVIPLAGSSLPAS